MEIPAVRAEPRPFLPILLEKGEARLGTVGLVDSGSDSSFLPRDIATRLGLRPVPLAPGAAALTSVLRVGVVRVGLRVPSSHGALVIGSAPFLVPARGKRPSIVVLGRSPLFEEMEIRFQDWRSRFGIAPRRDARRELSTHAR